MLYSIRLNFEVCTVKWTDLKPQDDFLSFFILFFFGLEPLGIFFGSKEENLLNNESLLHVFRFFVDMSIGNVNYGECHFSIIIQNVAESTEWRGK